MSDLNLLQALNLSQAKNGSIVGIIVCVAVILLILRFISSLIVRIALSLVFAGLGVVTYSQRASLVDCAEKISASTDVPSQTVTCSFFGRDVTISLDSIPSGP